MLEAGMKNDLNVDQIKKLWILDLILSSGSLKAAASRAKISPSAVSQSLSALEKAVGRPLVVRQKGSVAATPEALSILEVVRPAFEAFEKLGELGSQPVPRLTWLNFGAYESIAIDVLPGLVGRLRERLPDLRLGLRICRTGELLTLVRKGELCSAIISEVDDLNRFYSLAVAEERLGVYVSRRHPIASFGEKAPGHFGLGSLSPGKDGHPRYYQRFLKKMDGVKPTVLSESFETLRATAAAGVIAAILPEGVARRHDDLLEITPKGTDKEAGRHRLFVISQPNCDREEAQFLAEETRLLLQRR